MSGVGVTRDVLQRYNSIAISLHWLIAIFIIGLLTIGKYMTQLTEDDPLRFTLTQWHKSFGVTVLLLVLVRVFWRITHKPPALPTSATLLERFGSHAVHLLMYLLMIVMPLSGWVMVSASPLNLKTELFGILPWPHISSVETASGREVLATRAETIHSLLANAMILLVLLHVGAAFFHQLYRRDGLISRMLISEDHARKKDLNHGLLFGLMLAIACGFFLVNQSEQVTYKTRIASSSEVSNKVAAAPHVGFTAMQMGDPIVGTFESVDSFLSVHVDQIDLATLSATVVTNSVNSGDSQLDSTVVTADWFDSERYPLATFTSNSFESTGASSFIVNGDLTIKDVTKKTVFELLIESGIGRGEFTINRSEFGVGQGGQDEFVDPEVVLVFEVQNMAPTAVLNK